MARMRVPSTAFPFDAPSSTVVQVDLKTQSVQDLKDAIGELETELGRREHVDPRVTEFQLKHVLGELVADEANQLDHRVLSLEHLELYHHFCSRVVAAGLPPAVDELLRQALALIAKSQMNHPMRGVARSGDKEGADEYSIVKVPLGRRRQMAVMLYLNLLTGPSLVFLVCLLLWLYLPYSNLLALLYAGWVTFDNYTRKVPTSTRVSQWWRGNAMFHLFRDYFPIRHIKAHPSKDFSPQGNYLFAYHPHGVQSAGAFAMASKASGFDELFPGLSLSVQTLSMNFKIPFSRENLIALGAGDASKECLVNVLKGPPGASACLVTGGAKESLLAHPFTAKVVLKDRAGFVKLAIQTGASLVPMWGFGENNLYENLAIGSPRILRWQRRIQRMLTFAPLLVQGRGVFSYAGGVIPRRRPITVVIGDPIDVGQPEEKPSMERIARVHAQYKAAVQELFDHYREIYDPKVEDLEFV